MSAVDFKSNWIEIMPIIYLLWERYTYHFAYLALLSTKRDVEYSVLCSAYVHFSLPFYDIIIYNNRV